MVDPLPALKLIVQFAGFKMLFEIIRVFSRP